MKKEWKRKRQKQFLERIGLVIIIVSVVSIMNIDAETLIVRFISSLCMFVVFVMGLVMYVFPDELLKMQYKSMKHKNLKIGDEK